MEKLRRIDNLIFVSVIVIGAMLALSLVLFINKSIDENIKIAHTRSIKDLEYKITIAFDQFVHPLEGNAAIFHQNNFVITPSQFRRTAEFRNMFKSFKGALGFGFIRNVKNEEISKYVNKQRKIRKQFQLKRLTQNKSLSTDNLYVIELVEPLEVNSQAVGLVISDEERRFVAANKSMIEGRPILTKPIALVQADKRIAGFLLLYPIYQTIHIPITKADRIKQFVGWSYAPILSNELYELIKKLSLDIPSVRIYDYDDLTNPLFDNTNPDYEKYIDSQSILEVFGNKWLIKYSTSYTKEDDYHHYFLSALFLLLLTCFIFLSVYIRNNVLKIRNLKQQEEKIKREIRLAIEDLEAQRTFFRKILDSTSSMISYWDKELNNVFMNRESLSYFGKNANDLKGVHLSKVLSMHAFDANKTKIDLALVGKRQIFTEKFIMSDSSCIDISVKYIPYLTGDTFEGLIIIKDDISEIVKKDEKIQMLLDVIENAPVAIEITDKELNIEYVNKFHFKNSGYTIEEVQGKKPSMFASGKTPAITYEKLRSALNEKKSWTGDFINSKKNGEEYIEDTTISCLLGSSGEVSHYVAVKKDVTELRKTQLQLMSNSRLVTLGEMAAGVAHEINNPLTVLMMIIESLRKSFIREGGVSSYNLISNLDKMHSHTNRISKIVKSLKLYSRSAQVDEFKKVKISSILDSVMALCFERIKFKEIDFEIQNFEDFEIDCNEIEIQQVLVNLINNAYDAIEKLSQRWIKIVVEFDQVRVAFKVLDSGSIAADLHSKIFNPFFTTKEIGKGTGLGLSISMAIAQEHQGTIYLDQSFQTTCFVLEIPKYKNSL